MSERMERIGSWVVSSTMEEVPMAITTVSLFFVLVNLDIYLLMRKGDTIPRKE